MRRLMLFLFVLMIIMLFATQAFAGVLGTAKELLTGEVIALEASAIIVIVGGVIGLLLHKLIRTFREALVPTREGRKLTYDELGSIVVWGVG